MSLQYRVLAVEPAGSGIVQYAKRLVSPFYDARLLLARTGGNQLKEKNKTKRRTDAMITKKPPCKKLAP